VNAEKFSSLEFDYDSEEVGDSLIVHADCFEWLGRVPENSLHAIVTDPPYGVKEYDFDQLEKMDNGSGGIWRIPPSFDGNERSPVPRFTALSDKEIERLERFFEEWAELVLRALRPGGHVFIASNAYISHVTFPALIRGGLEWRGELIRLIQTLRGGDRPKNAHEEFDQVCSMARGCYEPWGILRKPLGDLRVQDCLREWETGGLRRLPDGRPFMDVIDSQKTPKSEREIADHPNLKPQSFLRQVVYAALPLGRGVICDPFMGSGSTIAAADAQGLRSVGIERYIDYFEMASDNILDLSKTQTEYDYEPQNKGTKESQQVLEI
jgi:site-specific DNA-methyltransferase (adenine-specific)